MATSIYMGAHYECDVYHHLLYHYELLEIKII